MRAILILVFTLIFTTVAQAQFSPYPPDVPCYAVSYEPCQPVYGPLWNGPYLLHHQNYWSERRSALLELNSYHQCVGKAQVVESYELGYVLSSPAAEIANLPAELAAHPVIDGATISEAANLAYQLYLKRQLIQSHTASCYQWINYLQG